MEVKFTAPTGTEKELRHLLDRLPGVTAWWIYPESIYGIIGSVLVELGISLTDEGINSLIKIKEFLERNPNDQNQQTGQTDSGPAHRGS